MTNLQSAKLKPLNITTLADGTLGIENLKSITEVVVTFTVDIINVIKTKNYFKLVEIGVRLLQFGNIIEVAKTAFEEIKNLSGAEAKEWSLFFNEVLDLEDDKAEAAIEQAFGFIPKIYALVLSAIDVITNGKELYNEIVALFKGTDQVEELTVLLTKQAA